MLELRPDLVKVLSETLYRDRRVKYLRDRSPGTASRCSIPRRSSHHELRSSTIEKAQRFDDVPRLTDAQREAFSLIERIATDPKAYLNMDFEPGDIQTLNNHYIMHSRTAYEDYPDRNAGGTSCVFGSRRKRGRRLPIRTTNLWIKPIGTTERLSHARCEADCPACCGRRWSGCERTTCGERLKIFRREFADAAKFSSAL